MNGNQLSAEASKYYTKIPTGEKVAYGFWGFGSDLVWQTVSLYLTFYYTDIFGISAAQVTLLFLVSRIWDAINDPLMGIIIDKVHLKNKNNYKYIPWFQRLVIPFGIVTVLVFTTPVDFKNCICMVHLHCIWNAVYSSQYPCHLFVIGNDAGSD